MGSGHSGSANSLKRIAIVAIFVSVIGLTSFLTYEVMLAPTTPTRAEYGVTTYFSKQISLPLNISFPLLPYLNGTLSREEHFPDIWLRLNSTKAEITYQRFGANQSASVVFNVGITTNNITQVLGPSGASLAGIIDFEYGSNSEVANITASASVFAKTGPFELLLFKEKYVRDQRWRKDGIASNRVEVLRGFLLSITLSLVAFTMLFLFRSSSRDLRSRKILQELYVRFPALTLTLIFVSTGVYLFIGAMDEDTLARRTFFSMMGILGPLMSFLVLNPIGTLLHLNFNHFMSNTVGIDFPNVFPLGLLALGTIAESYVKVSRKMYLLIFFVAGYSSVILLPFGGGTGYGASYAFYWLLGTTVIALYTKGKQTFGRMQVVHYAIMLYTGFMFWGAIWGYLFPFSLQRLFQNTISDTPHPLGHLFALLMPFLLHLLRNLRKAPS